jgi:hypothetical protein
MESDAINKPVTTSKTHTDHSPLTHCLSAKRKSEPIINQFGATQIFIFAGAGVRSVGGVVWPAAPAGYNADVFGE